MGWSEIKAKLGDIGNYVKNFESEFIVNWRGIIALVFYNIKGSIERHLSIVCEPMSTQ